MPLKSNILLLSATIKPPSYVPNLIRTNPDVRFQDYKQALTFYLKLLENGKWVDFIVWVENSKTDISELGAQVKQAGFSNQVELISFFGLDYPEKYGRAYGEWKLIDYAMANSATIGGSEPEAMIIWKITGRYIVKNIVKMIQKQPPHFDIYCNMRTGLSRPNFQPLRWADMYLLAWTHQGYRTVFQNKSQELREDKLRISPEMRFRQIIEQSPRDITVIPRFKTPPLVDGIRGFDGQNFSQGLNLWKYYIRWLISRLFPQIWI